MRKEKTLSFGKYPDVSLKKARSLRDDAKVNLAEGNDPSALKKALRDQNAARAENTFGMFADLFLEKQEREGKAKTTLEKKAWLLGLAKQDLGQTPIRDISGQDVLQVLRKEEAKGHYETARRLRSTISAVFRYAIASGQTDTDPTFGLRDALINPQVRHRAAITDEKTLKRFLSALREYRGQPETKIALELLVLFACRPSELRLAKWEEFDFEKGVWVIPAERMKMRKEHRVPLTSQAISLLEELKLITGWNERLFPSQISARKPMSENTMNQAIRRMGFGQDEATAHGFRSTFSTFANESGQFSPDAIEAYCARQDTNAVRRAYNRSQYWKERVEIANWWSQFIDTMKSG